MRGTRRQSRTVALDNVDATQSAAGEKPAPRVRLPSNVLRGSDAGPIKAADQGGGRVVRVNGNPDVFHISGAIAEDDCNVLVRGAIASGLLARSETGAGAGGRTSSSLALTRDVVAGNQELTIGLRAVLRSLHAHVSPIIDVSSIFLDGVPESALPVTSNAFSKPGRAGDVRIELPQVRCADRDHSYLSTLCARA